MGNSESIQSFKKYGTNLSQTKWNDYAKDFGLDMLIWEKEWMEPILSMRSNLKTYQRTKLNKYATNQLSTKSNQERKTQIVQESQSVEPMSDTQGMLPPTQHPCNY